MAITCLLCHHRNRPNATICVGCGQDLKHAPHVKPRSGPSTTLVAALLCGALLVVAAVVAYRYLASPPAAAEVVQQAPPETPAPPVTPVGAVPPSRQSAPDAEAALATQDPDCPPQALTLFLQDSDYAMTRFLDDVGRAESGGTTGLANVVDTLQAARREYTQVPPPPCAADAYEACLDAMQKTIDGFLLFMKEGGAGGAAARPAGEYFKESRSQWQNATRELDMLRRNREGAGE